jgi:hypothetical protein
LKSFGVNAPIDVWPLLPQYSILAERYNDHFFSSQELLFPSQGEGQDVKWTTYFHRVLLPRLVLSDDVVRNVLRALRGIPCSDHQKAGLSLGHQFAEMTLSETKPFWAPEDMPDRRTV